MYKVSDSSRTSLSRDFPEQSDTQAPEQVFEENLKSFKEKGITLDECVENCFKSLEPMIATGRFEEIPSHYILFKRLAVKLIGFYCGKVTIAFEQLLKEKFADFLAHSFHANFSIPEEEKKNNALLKWVDQFYEVMDCLCKCQGKEKSKEFMDSLLVDVQKAFDLIRKAAIVKKSENMIAHLEKNETTTEDEEFFIHFAHQWTTPSLDEPLNLMERLLFIAVPFQTSPDEERQLKNREWSF